MTKSPLGCAAPKEVRRSSRTGNGWFVWMTGLWIVFFPWVLATTVWNSGWSEGLRVTLVVLFTTFWMLVSSPRSKAFWVIRGGGRPVRLGRAEGSSAACSQP